MYTQLYPESDAEIIKLSYVITFTQLNLTSQGDGYVHTYTYDERERERERERDIGLYT